MFTLIAASLLLSQAPTLKPKSAVPTRPSREAQIWVAVDERLSRQIDVWFNDGDFPKSISALQLETELSPQDYDAWTNLGWMQENVEEYGKAEATYLRYLAQNPADPDRALPIGEYASRKRDFPRVIKMIEPVLSNRAHPNNFRILAGAYSRLKRYDDSIRVWKQYLKLAPNDGSAKANLERVEKKRRESQ